MSTELDRTSELDLLPQERAQLLTHRPILVAYRGSIAHGTYVPPTDPDSIDDVDLVVAYIPDMSFYFGWPVSVRGSDIKVKQYDCAAYEVRHFASLLANANPNLLSSLWCKEEHFLLLSREGRMLRDARSMFLSKRAYNAFGGYAFSQLKRMTSFKDVESTCGCSGNFHTADCSETSQKGRGSQKRFATGFMGAKRKALVQRHGYDTKNAAHLIRLIRMGIELLRDGAVNVDRTGIDAEELREIKSGGWPLIRVKDEAERLFEVMRQANAASTLPMEPDEKSIDGLLMDMLSLSFMTEVAIRGNRLLANSTPQGIPLTRDVLNAERRKLRKPGQIDMTIKASEPQGGQG